MPEPCSIKNLVSSLKICKKNKNLDRAMCMYTYILNEGLENHKGLSEHIVAMFVECGSIIDAEQVFDRCEQNERSWTSLIVANIGCGNLHHALRLYKGMREDDVDPSSFTLVGVLKACGMLGEPERGREIYEEVIEKGLIKSDDENGGVVIVVNTLISMYARCGLMFDACCALETMENRNVVSWTALIVGYVEHGHEDEALKCFAMMQKQDCITPNAFTFSSVLKACSNIQALNEGRKIHIQIIQLGVENHYSTGNALVAMYAKCGCLRDAQEVFNKLTLSDSISWTALMVGYSEYGYDEKSLSLFDEMESKGIDLDAFIFACALKACGNLEALEKGQKIHLLIVLKEIENELCVANSLIGVYSKCGSLLEAQNVFDEIQTPNIISWAALITAYVNHGSNGETLKLFGLMQDKGILPNNAVFVCALRACGALVNLNSGGEIHTNVTKMGCEEDLMVSSTLLDMYAKCGSLLDAQAIFEKLESRNVVTWTALIGGYADHGPYSEALVSYKRMQEERIAPNIATYVCLLKACGNLGTIDNGICLHFEITWKGVEGDQLICNSLLCMYIKCGFVSRAHELFLTCLTRNIASWSSMIQGYGLHHDSHMVLSCFEEMQKQGVTPNAITFTCLLDACSHANLVVPGWEYFKLMKEEYGITPTVEHYTCMVDILARSGHLYNAMKFLEMTQCSTSVKTWAALLSACKTHGESKIGAKCFGHLLQVEQNMCGQR